MIEKIIYTVLHEAHRWQVEETMKTLAEGPKGYLHELPGLSVFPILL